MTEINYYFDDAHVHRPYTHSSLVNPGTSAPANALRGRKPKAKPGYWPCESQGKWVQVEDHRGDEGWLNNEQHTISDLGPYPEGWSITPPSLTIEEQQAAFTTAIQIYLDEFARTRDYDSILSAATYATSTVPTFYAEGQYAVEARDLTWAKAYAILDDVLSGTRAMPSIEEVITELPSLAWPAAPPLAQAKSSTSDQP